jgi:hypothetical protein
MDEGSAGDANSQEAGQCDPAGLPARPSRRVWKACDVEEGIQKAWLGQRKN